MFQGVVSAAEDALACFSRERQDQPWSQTVCLAPPPRSGSEAQSTRPDDYSGGSPSAESTEFRSISTTGTTGITMDSTVVPR